MTNPSKQKNIYRKSSSNDDKNPALKSFPLNFFQVAVQSSALSG